MPGTAVKLGPFIGGMNTLGDAASIPDNELVECINMEVDIDGSLVSRPPIAFVTPPAGGTTRLLALGVGVFPTGNYVFAARTDDRVYTYFGGTWALIASSGMSECIVQYNDKVWLPVTNASASNGCSYSPSAGRIPYTAMPKGTTAVIYKDRMYVAGNTSFPSRLYFSNLADPSLWTGADFIDINPGDGQPITQIIVFNDAIVIFKTDSTYVFSFDSAPTLGVVRRLSGTIGASKNFCAVLFESTLYVYHEGRIHELVNNQFTTINLKTPFIYDASLPSAYTENVSLSLFGTRLIIRYFAKIYSYNLRTRTWSEFQSNRLIGNIISMPSNASNDVNDVYYAGSCYSNTNNFYKWSDGFDNTTAETMTCRIYTKNYDFGIPYQFKRLFWWGADLSTPGVVTAYLHPIVYSFGVTWDSLRTLTWSQLLTWDSPIASLGVIRTDTVVGTTNVRRFCKFMQAIRFRQAAFEVYVNTTGTTITGPTRIFNLAAFIKDKEVVVKAIS